jgi:ribonuclease R
MSGKNKENNFKNRLSEGVLEMFMENPAQQFNYKQVAKKVGAQDANARQLVNEVLSELCISGRLTEMQRGKFKLKNKAIYTEGVVDMVSGGAAYVISEQTEDDVYIAHNKINHAFHGDRVKVSVFPRRKTKKPEGEIIEIISRNRTEFVGVIDIAKNFAFVIPDSNKMHVDFYVSLNNLNNAKHGDKVIVEMLDWPKDSRSPYGKIKKVLGKSGDHNVEMHTILFEYGFPLEFTTEVEHEAEKIPFEIAKEEIAKRRDFRKITTITIDPVDAKDFDDALSIQKLENGNWEIGVHIADVSHYVRPHSQLEKEARKRATSVYLVDRVVPMLPERLSNGVCSLRPNEDKLCFSAVFEMDANAKIHNQWFGKTIICSDRRFAYEEVQQIIETKKGDFKNEILVFNDLAQKLRKKRFEMGAIAFNKVEVRFKIDEKGVPLGVYIKESKEANQLIEDFMLLANRSVAEAIGKSKYKGQTRPFVYRIHDLPGTEKLQEFAEFILRFGYKIKINTPKEISKSLNTLMKEIKGKGEENIIETLAIRSMAKAIYTTENIGHYGLAFEYYTHFTSPIRRYPDVMVHRLLEEYLQGQAPSNQDALEKACEHSSEMEIKAANAERDSIKYKQVEFLMSKKGQIFDGVISGVTDWGLFVELIETKSEGLVRIAEIANDDYYMYNEKEYAIVVRDYGRKLRLGDKVKVILKKADLEKKQLDFLLWFE